jgi:hypothetical protein
VTLFVVKVLLSPICVVAVSMAGRRWGFAVAGILGGLPVVAGPILLAETVLHGTSFGADAAAGALLGLAGLTTFVVVYGRCAGDLGPGKSVALGWGAFLVVVGAMSFVSPPPVTSLLLVCCCFAIGLRLMPEAPTARPSAGALPRWDLPARGLAALGLVLVLTAVSGSLGAHLSGLLAPFPIITSVLAVFTHGHSGADQALTLLRNVLLGFYGFAAFCFTVAVLLPTFGTPAAFGLATGAALAVQAVVLLFRSRVGPVPTAA